MNNNLNDQNLASTIAEEGFSSSGTLETVQENIISVRNARIENKQTFAWVCQYVFGYEYMLLASPHQCGNVSFF